MTIDVNVRIATSLPAPARIGMCCQLADISPTVEWLGLGPHENYPDRQLAAQYGHWSLPLEQMHTAYIFPSENGLRCNTHTLNYGRWTLTGDFHFGISRYSTQQLMVTSINIYWNEEGTWLNIDGFHMGWAVMIHGARVFTLMTYSPVKPISTKSVGNTRCKASVGAEARMSHADTSPAVSD